MSFDVPAGAGFVILGRSGTGKSVMLRHIIGLVQAGPGTVFVEGDEISALDGPELSRVRQQGRASCSRTRRCSIRSRSARTSRFRCGVTPGWRDAEIRERAQREAGGRRAGAANTTRCPAALSGGMRKRAGLARALALDPRILLVDEPSAGLDPITADEIDDAAARSQAGRRRTLVVVTHNIPSARRLGDELLMLHEGRILARGHAPRSSTAATTSWSAPSWQSQHAG